MESFLSHGAPKARRAAVEKRQPHRLRFTTRDLFLLVSVCGVLALCGSRVSFFNRAFILSLVGNAFLVYWFVIAVESKEQRCSVAFLPASIVIFLLFGCFSLVMTVNAVLLAVVSGFLCVLKPPERKHLCMLPAATTCLAYVVVVIYSRSDVEELEQLRREFAPRSLAKRLDYEPEYAHGLPSPLSAEAQTNLAEFESDFADCDMSWPAGAVNS